MTFKPPPKYEIERLAWSDPELCRVECPAGLMRIVASFGSGLTRRAGDPQGLVWATGDRGPNLKIRTAVERYGLIHLEAQADLKGAKIMPRPDIGPALAQLRVDGDRVELLRTIRLTTDDGRPVPGVPTPGGGHAVSEPALTLAGEPLRPDQDGADTEGIAVRSDGSFIIGDEYGPSLLFADADGRISARWSPGGPEGALPPIAAKRQINRGFEALALSPAEDFLYLAFQSPLAHPDAETHERARHVRIWKLDLVRRQVAAQFLYPLDPPESFRRDSAKGPFGLGDIKLCEIAAEEDDRLLVLERGSESTKIYRIKLDPAKAVAKEHLDATTGPTLEEISAAGGSLPELCKELLFDSDDHAQVAPDMEGMAILSQTELLLVTDNDFGVEGAETSFWRLRFREPLFHCV